MNDRVEHRIPEASGGPVNVYLSSCNALDKRQAMTINSIGYGYINSLVKTQEGTGDAPEVT